MSPNLDLLKLLAKNKCKVMFKNEQNAMLLMVDYGNLTKAKPGQGLEIWGNAQKVFENVNTSVLRTYPNAELTSQASNSVVVYRIRS
jgi:hypothetical protein